VTRPLANDRDRHASMLTGTGRERITNHAEYSARAGCLGATPQVGEYGCGSAQPWRRPRPGASAGRRLRCVAATSAARQARRRAGWLRGEPAAARTSVPGAGMHQVQRERLVARPGRVARPVMRRCGGSLAAAVPAGRRSPGQAMMHPVQLAAPGCIALSARATMMRATQRNQPHHRCIRSRRPVKSQVTAAVRWPGGPRASQGRTLRRRQRVSTQTAECCI
jgi:hypothetical protein